jgi:hypothetical protein
MGNLNQIPEGNSLYQDSQEMLEGAQQFRHDNQSAIKQAYDGENNNGQFIPNENDINIISTNHSQ